MPVIDIHAHYVSPELIDEAARNGAHYGVKLQDDAQGKQRLVIADMAPLRPLFAELSDLSLRLPICPIKSAGSIAALPRIRPAKAESRSRLRTISARFITTP